MPYDYLMEAIERLDKDNKMIMHNILDGIGGADEMESKWDDIVALILIMLDELGEEEDE